MIQLTTTYPTNKIEKIKPLPSVLIGRGAISVESAKVILQISLQ